MVDTEDIFFPCIYLSLILGGQIVMGNIEKYQTHQREIFRQHYYEKTLFFNLEGMSLLYNQRYARIQ